MAVDLTKHGLSRRDQRILDLERSWWKYEGAKVTHVSTQLGMNITAYYARLNWLLDQPAALEHDPMTVRRLRRLRDRRAQQRSARARGIVL